MKINNIGYLIKEGIRGIFLHGFMSFAAVCITVACLLIVGTFSSIMYNVNIMVEELNQTNEVLVYIDSDLPEAEAKSIGTKINRVDNVQQAIFVSREEALDNFLSDHQGDDAFSGIEASDLRHRFVVTLEDNALLTQTVEDIEAIDGVVKINAEYELAEGFSTLQNILRVVSVVFIAVLLMVSLLIISNTVKLGMYDRKDEIAIMKMVGATNSFIRLPFMVEGFTLGMIGSGISFGLLWLLYDWARDALESIDTLQLLTLQPFQDLWMPMLITFVAAGLFVGIVGSWTSIRKFMNV
jgi:cell division transport system permease protein